MPHSLRAKLSSLRYKGILEDKDYKRLCKAIDNEDVLEQIRAEIERKANSGQWSEATIYGMQKSIAIIDKYTK